MAREKSKQSRQARKTRKKTKVSKNEASRVVKRYSGVRMAPLKTASQYFARGERFQETWSRVAHVIAKMRSQNISMTRAAREVGISPSSVKKWGSTALRKSKSGRFLARKTDRLLRILQTPTSTGSREIAVKNSREATILAEHSAALSKYVTTGDASDLTRFADVHVTDVSGNRVRLITDLAEIDKLSGAGILSFESLYSRG